ncbi:hypothetical protein L7F22_046845 [Adiantum nelumboides]|nr:hypothetical protein [Adiantum nelumboides]
MFLLPITGHCQLLQLLHPLLLSLALCQLHLTFLSSRPFIGAAPVLPQSQSPLLHLGSLTFPVHHRSSSRLDEISSQHSPIYELLQRQQTRARRILDIDLAPRPTMNPLISPALSPPSSVNVPALRGKLVTLSQPFGQYFAELHIGTPAKPLALIIDSGSQLMWIQCQPCINCGPQASAYPIFDPARSSSYTNVMCNVPACADMDGGIAFSCADSGACEYKVSYGDNSNSSGILAADTLTFTTASGTSKGASASSFELWKFVFGCGDNNVGIETHFNASGLMGLDRGPYSVISQLNVDVFSYCLPNRESSIDVTGYLTFGRSDANTSASASASASPANPSLQYTPMLQNSYSSFLSHFYYLGLTGISINGQLLNIPLAALELDAETGMGGTIIDSGTTLTTFVDEVYTVILTAFDSYVDASLKKVELEEDNPALCYEVPLSKQKGAPVAPPVTLHFKGSAAMVLSTEHLFHLYGSDTTYNYYCLAMSNSGPLNSGAKNFIGNFQQQNFLIEYDIGNSRVGFAPVQCSPTNNEDPSSSHATITTVLGKPFTILVWHLTFIIWGILLCL